jgi:hypothetical protein
VTHDRVGWQEPGVRAARPGSEPIALVLLNGMSASARRLNGNLRVAAANWEGHRGFDVTGVDESPDMLVHVTRD